MEIEDTTLIRTIKKYPQVYDPTTQEFKSLDDKEKAWNSISLEIGYDGNFFYAEFFRAELEVLE
jgi:hypothetical protein